MKKSILTFSIVIYSSLTFGQLKLDLSDSTTYIEGFETSFDVNYQDTFVNLDTNTSKAFETIVQFHKDNPTFLLELGVHQDHLGSETFNLKQSDARARRIIELLQKEYNVDISKFVVIGYGESKPIIEVEKIDKSRFENDKNLLQTVANLNRRLSLKILQN
tara:strand:+ start:1632 stop:2114 length:483 start_codon:yes stop_codon:yes gene_type:complete